jgi:hypothetical protein
MRRYLAMLSVLVLAGAGCGGGSTGTHANNLQVLATDAPFPATALCLQAVAFEIDSLTLVPATGTANGQPQLVSLNGSTSTVSVLPGAGPIPTSPTQNASMPGRAIINVLGLRNGIVDIIALAAIPPGTYTDVIVTVKDAVLSFTDGSQQVYTPVNPMVDIKPGTPIIAPGPAGPFIPTTQFPGALLGQLRLILDFQLAESFFVTATGDQPTCQQLEAGPSVVSFQPTIDAQNLDLAGTLFGTTNINGVATGNVEVLAFPSGSNPLTTTPTATTFSSDGSLPASPQGAYTILLPPGTYDVFVQPQGSPVPVSSATGLKVAAGTQTPTVLNTGP